MRKRVCQVVTIVLFLAVLLTGIGYGTKAEKKQGFFAATKETEQSSSEKLEYMAVEKPYLQTPDVQKIVASFGADNTVISKAEIAYENTTAKTEGSVEATQITKEGVVFEIPYSDEKEEGIYKIKSLTYTTEKGSKVLVLKNIGMDITYGVEKQADTEPDAVVAAEEDPQTEMSIVSFDENGIRKSESSIEEAIVNAEQEVEKEQDGVGTARFSSNGNVVVVLDPGHDATHGGTSGGGLKEAEVNLKIALACRDELQQYGGVEVYMTRDTASCPYPGTGSGDDNANRVAYAASVGANVYVSIHCNYASSTSAKGVEVYYPNSNYNSAVGQAGSELAAQVLDQLVSLGLANRGTHIKNSGNNSTYPDGSLADYYGVIRNSKLSGFPGIIIEHGFQSNESDVNNFLGTDEGCRRLGIADATAIANYYNLSKDTVSDTVYNGVDYSAVYNKDYYYSHYSDLAAGYGNNARLLLKHFVEHGMSEGRQGNSIFQVQYYKNRYGDLRNGFGDDLKQYYMHFLQNGIYEGRQGSAVFDVFSYINRYADLRRGFGNNLKAYYMHYVDAGEKEGRIATGCPTMQNAAVVYNGVNYSAVYNYEYYKTKYPDISKGYGYDDQAVLAHFVNHGMSEGRHGSAEFNVYSYRNQYSDLRQGYGNNLKLYYMHYVQYGKSEGRKGTGCNTLQGYVTVYNGVDYSAVYNYNYYISMYGDIARAYAGDDIKTLAHFVNNGMSEGRQGSAEFNVNSYRNQYGDLRRGFGNNLKAYYLHYINSGKSERRKGTGCNSLQGALTVYNGVDYSAVYAYDYYIKAYGDIANAYGGDDVAVLAHFVNHGMSEGRQGNTKFNVYSYRNQYSDLRQAYGNNLKPYYMHYVNHGKSEGRQGVGCSVLQNPTTVYNGVDYSAVYNYDYYTKAYGDIARAYGGDETAVLAHFVNHGMSEGRQGSQEFNVYNYKSRYADLANAFGNNLKSYYLHYVNNGKSEGRTGV